jgi:hypothetical protein
LIRQEARKQFFFEKKDQKTFIRLLTRPIRLAKIQTIKSFLVLFFKKELLPSCSYLLWQIGSPANAPYPPVVRVLDGRPFPGPAIRYAPRATRCRAPRFLSRDGERFRWPPPFAMEFQDAGLSTHPVGADWPPK